MGQEAAELCPFVPNRESSQHGSGLRADVLERWLSMVEVTATDIRFPSQAP